MASLAIGVFLTTFLCHIDKLLQVLNTFLYSPLSVNIYIKHLLVKCQTQIIATNSVD